MTTAPDESELRVLVVDDSKDVADTLGLMLQMSGFDVQVAYGGEEALNRGHVFKPHCVLTDIAMPGMDGYRLAERMRRDEVMHDVTLVAITGNPDEAKAKAAGFDDQLIKPADPERIERIIRKNSAHR